jgi:hypothetical protein
MEVGITSQLHGLRIHMAKLRIKPCFIGNFSGISAGQVSLMTAILRAHTHARTHIHTRTHIYTRPHTHTHTHTDTHTHTHTHKHTHMHTHTHTDTHTRTHTYTHTHTIPQNYTTVAFRNIRRQSIFALAGIEYPYDQLYSAFGKSLYTYKRCWKWCPRASLQAWTRLILFANTFWRSASESRCTLIKGVGSDVHGPTLRRLRIATHTPKCTATFRTHCT